MSASSKSTRVIVGLPVVALTIAALVWTRPTSTPAPASSGPGDLPVVAFATPTIEPVGPQDHRHGVPVGWRRDDAGAVAAAGGYVGASGLLPRVGPLERQDLIAAFTTMDFRPVLVATTNRQLDELLFSLGARGRTAEDLIWRELALTAHVASRSTDRIEVDVWSVTVVFLAGGSVARQTWRTSTLTLVWQDGDWKVDRWDTAAGPTPGLAVEATLSPVPAVRDVAAWPSAGGGS